MKVDIKENWIAALTSGEYEQARGSLIDNTEGQSHYCCLGVLCDLAVKEGVEGVRIQEDGNGARHVQTLDDRDEWVTVEDENLPAVVSEWAGLDCEYDPRVGVKNIPLSQINDGSDHYQVGPHDFVAIARIIEKNL